jgi:hypothetical protein
MRMAINHITRHTGSRLLPFLILLVVLLIPVFSRAQQKTTSPGNV